MWKNTRPIALWDLNPLVLAYQANSFTISELQLRVFQIKIERMGFTPSCTSCHLPSMCLAFLDFHHRLDMNYVFPKHSDWQSYFNSTLLLLTFACRQFLPIEVAKGLHGLFVHSLKWSERPDLNWRHTSPQMKWRTNSPTLWKNYQDAFNFRI